MALKPDFRRALAIDKAERKKHTRRKLFMKDYCILSLLFRGTAKKYKQYLYPQPQYWCAPKNKWWQR